MSPIYHAVLSLNFRRTDVQNMVAERQYYDQLAALCWAWYCGTSLSIRYSFDVTLPNVAKPEGQSELPSFAHNCGDYKLVITEVLQPFMEPEAHWSVVCTAEFESLPGLAATARISFAIFSGSIPEATQWL